MEKKYRKPEGLFPILLLLVSHKATAHADVSFSNVSPDIPCECSHSFQLSCIDTDEHCRPILARRLLHFFLLDVVRSGSGRT